MFDTRQLVYDAWLSLCSKRFSFTCGAREFQAFPKRISYTRISSYKKRVIDYMNFYTFREIC